MKPRDWSYIQGYYAELLQDIYAQPEDVGHTDMAQTIIDKWITLLDTRNTVLDVGCGVGFTQPMFERFGYKYTGIAIGKDVLDAQAVGRNVVEMDYNFLEYPDNSFELIFSRHSLEHSPFALLTLMEWWRVAKLWLLLVIPTPKYWTWAGLNHYGMMAASQARFLLSRAGWRPIWEDMTDEREFRFFCEKYNRTSKHDDDKEEYETSDIV